MKLCLALLAFCAVISVQALLVPLPSSTSFGSRQLFKLRRHTALCAGFGKPTNTESAEVMKATRPTVFREVRGQYAKILARKSVFFENMKKSGISATNDIYVRASNSETFYFVGKLIHKNDEISAQEALQREAPLIFEYAKSLRPKDLSGPLAVHFSLELFTAPPNSEMDTAQNKNDLTKTGLTNTNTNTNTNKNQRESSDSGSGSDSDSKEGKEGKEEEAQIKSGQTVMGTGPGAGAISIISDLSVGDERVGFEPEVYEGGEMGFRVKRSADGSPLAPAFEVATKSPAELEAMENQQKPAT